MEQQTPIMMTLSPRITNPFKYALYMLIGFVLFDLFVTTAYMIGITPNAIAGILCLAIMIINMGIATRVCTAIFDGPASARLGLLGTACDLYFAFYIFIHMLRLFHQTKTACLYKMENATGYA